MEIKKYVGAVVLMSIVGACSSNDAADADVDVDAFASLAERAAAAVTAENFADPESLSGSATMSGNMLVGGQGSFETFGEADVLIGNMNVVANFEESTLTGDVTDFGAYTISGFEGTAIEQCITGTQCSSEQTESFAGSLDVDATISGNEIVGPDGLTGVLFGDVFDEETNEVIGTAEYDVFADISGGFLEDDQGLLAVGNVVGDVQIVETIDGIDSDPFVSDVFGGFVVAE